MQSIKNTEEACRLIRKLKKQKVNSYSNQGNVFVFFGTDKYTIDNAVLREFTNELLEII